MVMQRSNNITKSDRWSYLWLAIGAILLVFLNGRWIIPLATWLAPVFLMRFLRKQKPARGLALVALTNILVFTISWQGMIPVPGVFYYLVVAGIGLIYTFPFLADRFIAHIRKMCADMDIPSKLDALRREDVPEIAKAACSEAHSTYAVPRYMDETECETFVARMLA